MITLIGDLILDYFLWSPLNICKCFTINIISMFFRSDIRAHARFSITSSFICDVNALFVSDYSQFITNGICLL